jgi:alkylresorcinol/alkylpyrone synthase/polyketide synthase Type III
MNAEIIGVATATSEKSYSQRDILDLFQIEEKRIRLLFLNSAIEQRFLTLPAEKEVRAGRGETQGELLKKHRNQALKSARARLETVCNRQAPVWTILGIFVASRQRLSWRQG